MYKKVHLVVIFSFFILTTCYILPNTIFAQSANTSPLNLTAYPSNVTIAAKPGSTTVERFRIRNNTDTALTLSLSLKKLVPDPNGTVTLADFTNKDTYQNWISFPSTSVNALPREWTDITYTLKIPTDTAFGYYYVIYIAPKTGTQTNNKTQATLNGTLAIPVLLTVDKPGATINGSMLSFVSALPYTEYLPMTFDTTFANSGNILIRPTGNIFIKDWKGKLVDTLIVNSNGNSILPGGKRIYETTWDNSFVTHDPIVQDGTILRDSQGNPKTHLVFHFDRVLNLRIGKYTAVALTVIPTQTRDLSFQTAVTFWVFPWKFVGLALLIIIFVGIGIINTGRSVFKEMRKIFRK